MPRPRHAQEPTRADRLATGLLTCARVRPLTRRTLLAAAPLVGAAALAGCADAASGSGARAGAPTTSAASPTVGAPASTEPSVSTSPTAQAAPTLEASPAAVEGPAFTSEESSSAPAEGSALVPTALRVGAHPEEGYDRVVVELTGPGVPGWHTTWVEQAHTQGKGDPLDLAGSRTLVVYGTGMTMVLPSEAPGALESGQRLTVPDGTALVEVDLQLPFEDQLQLTLGTETDEYRVLVLTEPTRLVVDVRRP